ncbi:hypothetical protein [Metasolibacillus sp.]|uniref:hypothetical protein n=1 Tax=Metasolibacillus sp. TaxID=2703680 RepID=UPI0025DF9D37|nr:hypothetical protein [Metasolibacillus sp.]MCT6924121.1 hypothetical protein [Metasolibacillus sp.]MCT6940228.1 hypothetical protein [Metasolibacillus sp.]
MAHSKLKIGDRVGILEIVDFSNENIGRTKTYYCVCQCDCGNTIKIRRSNFGKAKSCGCLKNTKGAVGDKNGLLTVIDRIQKTVEGRKLWYCVCQCECGNVKEIMANNFKTTKSCGCAQYSTPTRLFTPYSIGDRFGRLEIKEILSHKNYLCTCDCGNVVVVYHYNLKDGSTRSCGCLKGPSKSKIATVVSDLAIGTIHDFLFVSEAAELWNVSSISIRDRIKQMKLRGSIDFYTEKGWIRQHIGSGNWLLSKNIMVEWYGEQLRKEV